MTERESFEPVMTGVSMVKVAYDLYPSDFRWKEPPYEYVYDRNPFDVIAGTSSIREAIESGCGFEDIQNQLNKGLTDFNRARGQYLSY